MIVTVSGGTRPPSLHLDPSPSCPLIPNPPPTGSFLKHSGCLSSISRPLHPFTVISAQRWMGDGIYSPGPQLLFNSCLSEDRATSYLTKQESLLLLPFLFFLPYNRRPLTSIPFGVCRQQGAEPRAQEPNQGTSNLAQNGARLEAGAERASVTSRSK